ncbi:MAG: hypothetical protein ACTSVY_05255 [Candidatus Helarchaeota archaeon]
MVMTSIRFSNKEKLEFYQSHAKQKYNLDFSKYIRMLIEEDIKNIKKPFKQVSEDREIIGQLNLESDIVDQLKFENDLLKKEIQILKEQISLLIDLNTKKILQKLEGLTFTSENVIDAENRILELLNKRSKGKRIRLTLSKISKEVHVNEIQVIRILDDLIDKEQVKLFQGMKYGRID